MGCDRTEYKEKQRADCILMSVNVSKELNNCIVITVVDVLSYGDLQAVQDAAKEMLKSDTKINCLILADKFSGWGKAGDWGDLTFMYETDAWIHKIAVVAKENLRDELLMFLGAGRRQAVVKFFSPDQEDKARGWLSESAE
jgi:hypothetical protein